MNHLDPNKMNLQIAQNCSSELGSRSSPGARSRSFASHSNSSGTFAVLSSRIKTQLTEDRCDWVPGGCISFQEEFWRANVILCCCEKDKEHCRWQLCLHPMAASASSELADIMGLAGGIWGLLQQWTQRIPSHTQRAFASPDQGDCGFMMAFQPLASRLEQFAQGFLC